MLTTDMQRTKWVKPRELVAKSFDETAMGSERDTTSGNGCELFRRNSNGSEKDTTSGNGYEVYSNESRWG